MSPAHSHLGRISAVATITLAAACADARGQIPGRFDTASRAYPVGNPEQTKTYRPSDHAVVDLDGDGDLDVVHSTTDGFFPTGSLDFVMLFNRGDGTFDPPEFHPMPGGKAACVVAADLDGDGDPDLAFGQTDTLLNGQQILFFFNDGTGHFGAQNSVTCGKGPTDIVALDVDGDLDIDLITANQSTGVNSITVRLNNGGGAFPVRRDYDAGPKPVWLDRGDVDADGDIDLLVQSGTSPHVRILSNDGTGLFSLSSSFSGSNFIRGAAFGDVDEDGDLDVVHTGGPTPVFTSNANLYLNNGQGSFTPGATIPLAISFGAHHIVIEDVTLDGHLDLLITNFGQNYGWLLVPGKGDGTFFPSQAFGSGQETSTISAADMDGDGDRDVVITNEHSKTVTVHENREGSFDLPPVETVAQLTTEFDAADIDLDGDLDVVTVDSTIHVLFNQGNGTFLNTNFAPLLSRFKKVRLRDLNGDGYADLLLAKNTCCPPYYLYVAMNDGTGHFGTIVGWQLGSCGGNEIETLDFDNDGDLDVAFSETLGCFGGSTFQRIFLLRNQGNGTFQPPIEMSHGVYAGTMFMQSGDYNGDGNVDLAVAAGNLLIQFGNGNGSFQAPISYSPTHGLSWMKAADMNGDGHLDIAYASTGEGTIGLGGTAGVMLNQGDGTFVESDFEWGAFSLDLLPDYGVDVIDADADGHLDIVTGAIYQDSLLYFRGLGDGTIAPKEEYGLQGHVNLIQTGDFDGDGKDDIAALLQTFPPIGNSHVSILRGLGPLCAGKATTYGVGCAGSGAITPSLVTSDCPTPGDTLQLQIFAGLGGSTAVLLIGTGTSSLPLGGGCALLNAPLLPFTLTLPLGGSGIGNGDTTINSLIPQGAGGVTITLQAFVIDAASPTGYSATAGLELKIP